jgi:IS30 family transposase
MHAMTSDNRKEFANHINISKVLEVVYYFARLYHGRERGANGS